MKSIKDRKLDEVVKRFVDEGRPLLGICLGMQLLFDQSDEGKRTEGLGRFLYFRGFALS